MNKIVEEDAEQGTGILWLGDYTAATDKKQLKEKGIKTVITTASGLGVSFLPSDGITHKQYNLLDIETQSISHCFDSTYKEIDEGLKRGGVLVHCAAGISRSATCLIAYLMKKNNSTFRDTINMVRSKRRVICPNFGFERQLKQFEHQLGLTPQNMRISSQQQQAHNINQNRVSSLNKLGLQNNLNSLANQKADFQDPSSLGLSSQLITYNKNNNYHHQKIPPIQSQAQQNAIKRNQRLQPMSNRNMAEIFAQKLAQNNENLSVLGIHKIINNNNNTNSINNLNNNHNNKEGQNSQASQNIQKLAIGLANNPYNNGPNIVTYSAKNNLRTSSRGPVPIHNQTQNKGSNIATSNNFRKRSVKNMYY